MSSARGRANQSLYLARILVEAWEETGRSSTIPDHTLSEAFLPAIRNHLLDAYGWFLLALSGLEEPPETGLPRSSLELPKPPEGKAVPSEVREFAQLEQEGWLRELLAPLVSAPPRARSRGNLAVPSVGGAEQALAWSEALKAVFDRMGDSLEES
ncbi:MAG: hypothetical protein AAGA91_17960 [Pseudomonadota bacterium]